MNLSRTIRIQLTVFVVVAAVVMGIVGVVYMQVPARLFGIGQYQVRVELADSGNLYPNSNVTYRGTKVGKVTAVRLTETGLVVADLSLKSGVPIPSDLDAKVHSQTAIGEQYVALSPRNGTAAPLKDGDVIPLSRTSTPPKIGSLLDAANRGVEAIPNDSLKTVIDESYTALAGLGPEFARLVRGATTLAIDADKNLAALTALIDDTKPVLDSQSDTADSVQAWAARLATITDQLRTDDAAVAGLLEHGPTAAAEARGLFDDLNPTLPTVLANLVSVGEVAVTYQPSIEQLLVLLPQGVASASAGLVGNLTTKDDYKGFYLSFNLNLNLPPPCTTGFYPAQQQRSPALVDAPPRPPGDVYCRIPQDSMFNVRGARNYPCVARPGKRAPTARMCESDDHYVPLNDGLNWKGDPNATLSGQDVPELPRDLSQPAVPLAAAEYDPATGTYVGPDGNVYTQSDLVRPAQQRSWQAMLVPQELPR